MYVFDYRDNQIVRTYKKNGEVGNVSYTSYILFLDYSFFFILYKSYPQKRVILGLWSYPTYVFLYVYAISKVW